MSLQSHRDVPWIGLCSFFRLQNLWPLALFKDLQMISIKSFRNFGSVYYCLPSLQNQCVPKSSILVSAKYTVIRLELLFTLNSVTTSTTTVIAIFASIYLCTKWFFALSNILQVRLLSSTSDVAGCDDILKTYLLACELKNTKLSILGLVGMEKLIAHDAVLPSALPSILATLKEVSTEAFLLFTRSGLSLFL